MILKDQPIRTPDSVRMLYEKEPNLAERQLTNLIKHPFPKEHPKLFQIEYSLDSWSIFERLDLLPPPKRVSLLKNLLEKLGDEYINSISWNGGGPYDARVLDPIAVGMAAAYETLPPQNKAAVWGNKQKRQEHFAVLARTIQERTTFGHNQVPQARLGLERLLLGLLTQSNPSLLDGDFPNPIRGQREGQSVNPVYEILVITEEDDLNIRIINQYYPKAVTREYEEVSARLSELRQETTKQKFDGGFDQVLARF